MSGPESLSFELDGIEFIIDNRPGSERGKSGANRFILVKTPKLLEFYRELAHRKAGTVKSILELGMFEGGSLVMLDKLFRPQRLAGIDIRKTPIQPLEDYAKTNRHVRTYYGLSQADDALDGVLSENFPDGIDLVVDDASHLYELTRRTFELSFPHVRPGGLYLIEDWSWAHKPAYQSGAHPWFGKPALTNLIFELTLLTACTPWISSLEIHQDFVVIEKASSQRACAVDAYGKRLRGKTLNLI